MMNGRHCVVTSAELQSALDCYRRAWIHTELPVVSVSCVANQIANVCFTVQESLIIIAWSVGPETALGDFLISVP